MQVSRRGVLIGATASLALCRSQVTAGAPSSGQPAPFTWEPERSTTGSVLLIVSIPEQMVHVFRGGVEIGRSACSTGKPGHRTPTGIFTILEKQRDHVSSIYKGAQMPNMERLTWSGIALHAGNLPGFPASHGCVRLPKAFSALLYEVTHLGAAVIIADEHTQPKSIVHPGLLLPTVGIAEASAVAGSYKAKTDGWQTVVNYPIVSVVISRADGMAYITTNGRLSGQYPARFAQLSKPIGHHVYSLLGTAADGSGLLWLALGVGKARSEPHIVNWYADAALKRVSFDDMARARAVANSFHPGTLIVVTDASAPRTTRGASTDFKVMSSEPEA